MRLYRVHNINWELKVDSAGLPGNMTFTDKSWAEALSRISIPCPPDKSGGEGNNLWTPQLPRFNCHGFQAEG